MNKEEMFTYHEIITQPEAWEEAVVNVEKVSDKIRSLAEGRFEQLIFTGCGSTYYLSLSAAAIFQEMTGISSRAVPGGELLFNSATVLTRQKTLLVAISRSGSTTETVRAVEKFKREQNGKVVVITNYGDQPLAGLADLAIILPKGQESSVAQTRSFASMMVAATAFAAVFAGAPAKVQSMHTLAQVGTRLLTNYAEEAHKVGADLNVDRFYFLGSGTRYGLACEANLKMKEMTLTHSEPFHFMEFRHGPMSMVTPNTYIIGLLSDANRAQEEKVLQEMIGLGGRVLRLAENSADIEFRSNLAEGVRGVLYLPVLQLIAFERAIAKGLNPDRPTNLSKVIQLDL